MFAPPALFHIACVEEGAHACLVLLVHRRTELAHADLIERIAAERCDCLGGITLPPAIPSADQETDVRDRMVFVDRPELDVADVPAGTPEEYAEQEFNLAGGDALDERGDGRGVLRCVSRL